MIFPDVLISLSGDSEIDQIPLFLIIIRGFMKAKCFLYFSILLLAIQFKAFAQCDSIYLGKDTTLCEGQTFTLNAGPGYDEYLWNTGSTQPTIIVDSTGIYWCTVSYTDSTNLVFNGDFSQGNIGFSTEYVAGVGGPWGPLSEEGTYVVGTMASLYHTNFDDCTDHTTGNGNYMIINGDTVVNENVWCQSVMIAPQTDYVYSSWFTSVNPDNPAVLEFRINGEVTAVIDVSSNTCEWQNSYITWNSNDNYMADLCIVNQNTEEGGNDFGIDDISLYKVCVISDSIEITFSPNPEVDLGNDTSLCIGQTIVLDAGSGFEYYVWNNGSDEQTYPATSPGLYSVTVFDQYGCVAFDSVNIFLDAGPEINLGNDTAICQGNILELSPGTGFVNYLWNNDSSLPYLFVNSSGYYSVQITDYLGCSDEDEIYVQVANPEVNIGNDSTICEGDTLILNAGEGFTNYSWQDGSTNSFYLVLNGGLYNVEIIDQFGCTDSDEINIEQLQLPYAELPDNQDICSGDTIILSAPFGNFDYYWNQIPGEQNLKVYHGGAYILDVVNLCGVASDEIYIHEHFPSIIDLGPDTILHPNESILLDAGLDFQSYLWQDGTTQNSYLIESNSADPKTPYYFVEIFNGFCKSSDTIKIEILNIWVPNVITPNNDFQNDVFIPDLTTWNGINDHTIVVYNRWGEKVWESSNFPEGWDGKLNGKTVSEGTYFWILEVFYGPSYTKQILQGSLTILGTND